MGESSTTLNTMSECSVLLGGIRFGTRAVLLVCTGVALLTMAGSPALVGALPLCPDRVIAQLELWRILTAAFTHGGPMHIIMNMITLVAVGKPIEDKLGSTPFIALVILIATLSGIIYIILDLIAVYAGFNSYCAVGFSGVLFALVVLETKLEPQQNRSIFGFFTVPSNVYPWALLVLLQIMLPGISFLGHLSGILVGFLCKS